MDYILNLGNINYLNYVRYLPIEEILVQAEFFSRFGSISEDELDVVIKKLKKEGKKVILAWDTISNDRNLIDLNKRFILLKDSVEAVRFIDPGVGLFLKREYPEIRLHLSLEHGNTNEQSILHWINEFSPNIDRVVLSNQFPASAIKSIDRLIDVKIEILGAGKIEMLYSSRYLLERYFERKEKSLLCAKVASDDRPKQISTAIENSSGTQVFYDKELFLLDCINDIKDSGIEILRLEYHEESDYRNLRNTSMKTGWEEEMKSFCPQKTTRGFFYGNHTHQLLKNLSNKYLKEENENKVGAVIESVKNGYTLIEIQKEMTLPKELVFISPEGKEINYQLESLKDLKGCKAFGKVHSGFYILPWIKHTVPATIIKLNQSKK
ncbi:U32 family peptidase [bacterium]|nr:U32 family peptidase [bacterium]